MRPSTAPSATRRTVLRVGLLGGLAVSAGCSRPGSSGSGRLLQPTDPVVAQVEAARATSGATVTHTLSAQTTTLDLAGRAARTWAFGDSVPGPLLRANVGDRIRVDVANALPDPTTIHWHGVRLRNDMDGVPDLTQDAIAPEASLAYDFVAPDPGTYFFHPHVGLQLDRGLYGVLVVDDPDETSSADVEWIVVLDDWLDGLDDDPDTQLERLQELRGMQMGHMGDGTGIDYPLYLVNGRPPEDAETFTAKPGQRVRLRVVNAAADTTFVLALGGHRMTITHKDGIPTRPLETEAVAIGMGERYDALVTCGDGAFPLVAAAVGKPGLAGAVLRTSPGAAAPALTTEVPELRGDVTQATALTGLGEVAGYDDTLGTPDDRPPDRAIEIALGMRGGRYEWVLNGATFAEAEPFVVDQGERVRMTFSNRSHAIHPMHLHGHSFRLVDGGSWHDTVLVGAMASVSADFVSDNPGRWALHCHNIYHAEAGMMAVLGYEA